MAEPVEATLASVTLNNNSARRAPLNWRSASSFPLISNSHNSGTLLLGPDRAGDQFCHLIRLIKTHAITPLMSEVVPEKISDILRLAADFSFSRLVNRMLHDLNQSIRALVLPGDFGHAQSVRLSTTAEWAQPLRRWYLLRQDGGEMA